ncbi:MAG TPA: hypothetical protein VET23_13905 [Chitinophagaceae bacterium]|nr:hypothetical protein [Chitinophagaceae bacterium]
MNGIVVPSPIIEMEPELLKNLVTETQETIAKDIPEKEISPRSFSIVDLWNIRKNSSSARRGFRR